MGRVGKRAGRQTPLGRWFAPSVSITPLKTNKWQYLVVAGELQSGSVSQISYTYIRTQVQAALGFVPTTYRIHGIRTWYRAGLTAATQAPSIKMSILNRDNHEVTQAEDYGDLSIPAKLGYMYSTEDQARTFTDVSASQNIATIDPSDGGTGTIQVMLSYYAKVDA